MTDVPARQRLPWGHAMATLLLGVVVWWAFRWQLSALQWLGLLLLAVVLWHALQARGRPVRPATGWGFGAVVLAAVAASLPLDQPWTAPWWPGSGLAGGLPDPCALGGEPGMLVPGGRPERSAEYADLRTDRRSCGWAGEDRLLQVELRRYPWQGTGDDALGDARRAFAERREHAGDAATALADLGDEAYRDPGEARLTVQARRANVIVDLTHHAVEDGTALTDAERAALERLAERAVAAVEEEVS